MTKGPTDVKERAVGKRTWFGLVLGLGAAILNTLLSVFNPPPWPRWVSVSIYVVSGVLAVVGSRSLLDVLERRKGQKDDAEERASQRRAKVVTRLEVALPPPRLLPVVGEVSPYGVGVSGSRYVEGPLAPHSRVREVDDRLAPYVPRDVDAPLDTQLKDRQQPFIVVFGDSKAGKSRTAFEAARRALASAALMVPKAQPGALTELFELDATRGLAAETVVLWLDGLDRWLGIPGGLDLQLLDLLAGWQPRVVILATITSQRRRQILDTEGEIGRAGRLVLDRALEIQLETGLSPREHADAATDTPGRTSPEASVSSSWPRWSLKPNTSLVRRRTLRDGPWSGPRSTGAALGCPAPFGTQSCAPCIRPTFAVRA